MVAAVVIGSLQESLAFSCVLVGQALLLLDKQDKNGIFTDSPSAVSTSCVLESSPFLVEDLAHAA